MANNKWLEDKVYERDEEGQLEKLAIDTIHGLDCAIAVLKS